MDAFFFARGHIGQRTVSFRVGQFSQFWGESLFFGNNGIAGGMAPIDVIKALSVPNWTFKELILPVPQVSIGFELAPNVSTARSSPIMPDTTINGMSRPDSCRISRAAPASN